MGVCASIRHDDAPVEAHACFVPARRQQLRRLPGGICGNDRLDGAARDHVEIDGIGAGRQVVGDVLHEFRLAVELAGVRKADRAAGVGVAGGDHDRFRRDAGALLHLPADGLHERPVYFQRIHADQRHPLRTVVEDDRGGP